MAAINFRSVYQYVYRRKFLRLGVPFLEVQAVDIDNWQNVRGPRPWEEGNEYNKILEESQKKTQSASKS
ncbi:hypothetical protein HPB48_026998 [Haemaphysalis longicornis]|uniref:Cytochrome c oxidase assembly protein COX16 homolog, mitochondrial n=1 Tax=Haemaphysalis longicornis TaxID=44386 RepID=A0A9J6HAV1_HAELO|nr:hypothetical protein HPB48_026998 [Haemaphysalis longicornis]